MTKMTKQSWRKEKVPLYTPNRTHPLLAGILLAFLAGYHIGQSETAPLVVKSIANTISSLIIGEGPPDVTTTELLGRLAVQRTLVERRLMDEYWDYYGRIFDPAMLEETFIMGPKSRERLVRRMMIKVAAAQTAELEGGGGGGGGQPIPPTTFTWATGGDSAAAAHGNLFNQSYTAVLEDTASDAFASLGIDFVAKNFAMGSMVSAPELALCMESVYGTDLDILHWDFGLTEKPEDVHRAALWGNRAGIHPTRPILFLAGTRGEGRWVQFLHLERMGMGSVLMDSAGLDRIRSRIPDSNVVSNPETELPESLRYYICNGAAEGTVRCDDPLRNYVCEIEEGGQPCKDHKFKTSPTCSDARYQVSWHPGWKEHLLKGRLLGYFLLDMLEEAVIELDVLRNPPTVADRVVDADWQSILDFLYTEMGGDIATFQSSSPSFDVWEPIKDTLADVNPMVVFRKPAICHTALLPSQERYDGILTARGGRVDPKDDYDKGENKALMAPPDDGALPLAFDANDRQTCDALEIDHKDFFFVREGDGWLSASVPNAAELEVYGKGERPEGLVLICLKVCPFGRCPDEAVGFGFIKRNRGKLFITIDGKPITTIKKLEGCHFMGGLDGIKWPGQAGSGAHNMRFRVEDPGTGHWLKISSIIVF